MKKRNVFLGNEICCGAYAFLNTVQDREIDHRLFEITSTVPFGIKHQKEGDFSRLLTTYCDPNEGLDKVAGLWGYAQIKDTFRDVKEAAEYIFEKSEQRRCLVGPLDMGRLGYLVLPNLYVNMDHYITIFRAAGELFCMDSEGIPVRRTSRSELESWLDVGELPEANGLIHVRSYEKNCGSAEPYPDRKLREESAVRNSLVLIKQNLTEAREEGQGNYAIEECWRWLNQNPMERWRLSFLYDISFLMQRKILQQYWGELTDELYLLEKKRIRNIEKIVAEQINVLGSMFHELQKEKKICEQDFRKLSELEERLTIEL